MAGDPSMLRLLIATDNHLGVHEEDPIRKDDSFNAFEEILAHAVRTKVDALLLGGDIFHENKPSRCVVTGVCRGTSEGDDAQACSLLGPRLCAPSSCCASTA